MPNAQELIDILLTNRGITAEDREKFLNPNFDTGLHDPFLMKDMERAVVRIFEAIEAKEKIVIYSDYDCDGIPAAVIASDLLKKIGYENFRVYIPHRHDEGYGLHMDAIKEFIEDGTKLVVTFDLGTTAIAEVREAMSSGIDIIVTDHHLPHGEVPSAYAFVNPKQDGCEYPFKELCGAGLAFKLVQAFVQKYGEYFNIKKDWLKWELDMAGLATIADQVELLGENRIIAYYGLIVLQKSKRPGLRALCLQAGVNQINITEDDVAFMIVPRINASSRMASPEEAFLLLSENDPKNAVVLAKHLEDVNKSRKQKVAHIMKDVKKTMSLREIGSIVVIGNPSWHIGVVGLVASKIIDEYKVPAFVWGEDEEGNIRGSCRAPGGVNLVSVMEGAKDHFENFGGHMLAGGFSVKRESIYFLEEKLLESFNNTKDEAYEFTPNYFLDAQIVLDDVAIQNYQVINKLAPFGIGNPKPTFIFKNLLINSVKLFGKEKNHLELSFFSDNGRLIKAIAFFKTQESFKHQIQEGERIDLIATFELSTFLGKTELRLRIVDIS